MMNKFFWILLFLMLDSFNASCQMRSADDLQFWLSINPTLRLNKNTELNGQFQVRLMENGRQIRGYYYSIGAKFDQLKLFSINTELRYLTNKTGYDYIRYAIFIDRNIKFSKFKLNLRAGFTDEFAYVFNDGFVKSDEKFIRLRGLWKKKIVKKTTLELSSELFAYTNLKYIRRIRNIVAIQYKFTNALSSDIGYMIQPNWNSDGFRNWTFGIQTGIKYDFL